MATTPKNRLVFIEDGVLLSMALNETYLREFPFLNALRAATNSGRPRCGRCQEDKNSRASILAAAKRTLAGLDSTRKERLKELLNAEKVRISYIDGKRSVERTF